MYVLILPMSGVAMWAPLVIKGAETARMMNRIDMTNIAVPAILPIRFKVAIPRDDSHKKSKKRTKQMTETAIDEIVLTKFPLPLKSQLSAMRIPCGFCARYGM